MQSSFPRPIELRLKSVLDGRSRASSSTNRTSKSLTAMSACDADHIGRFKGTREIQVGSSTVEYLLGDTRLRSADVSLGSYRFLTTLLGLIRPSLATLAHFLGLHELN